MASDSVRHALSYPFEIPKRSYVVAGGRYEELPDSAPPLDVSGRRPMLALGSNQSPHQLIRKFKDRDLGPIPVVRGRLHDFDVVYSAHVSRYGAIPATLLPCPGTRVTLFVTWLDAAQEKHMHETEGHAYWFGRLDGITLTMEIGGELTSAFVYVGRRGALARNGAPVALAPVKAENRMWPAIGQWQVQALVRDRLAPGQPVNAFIQAAVDDPAVRLARAEALGTDSLAFEHPGFAAEAL
ncbi:MAG: hypothetical protein HYW28_07550 [Rhodospirillales bacterium]|nr:hypothetical protein [Rhodospirillales bacterium]